MFNNDIQLGTGIIQTVLVFGIEPPVILMLGYCQHGIEQVFFHFINGCLSVFHCTTYHYIYFVVYSCIDIINYR